MKKRGFSIGDLAKGAGTKVVTVRYYEKIGLLPVPSRTAGNYRTYSNEHIRRLRFIRRCRDLGFTLDQIRDPLPHSLSSVPASILPSISDSSRGVRIGIGISIRTGLATAMAIHDTVAELGSTPTTR
jgi:DNA-binding transcriptional MerR regulator